MTRTRKVSRCAVALLAVVLSFAVVFGPKQVEPAAALDFIPTPTQIKTALRSPPAMGLRVGGTMATAGTVGGLGLGLVGLGLVAYATRDSWVPVVQDAWTSARTWFESLAINNRLFIDGASINGNGVTITYRYTNTSSAFLTHRLEWQAGVCRPVGGGALRTIGSGTRANVITGSSWPKSGVITVANLCGSAEDLVAVRARLATENSTNRSEWIALTGPHSASEHENTTTVHCRNYQGDVQTFTETDAGHPDRLAVPSCEERFPGSWPESGTITSGVPGGPKEETVTWTGPETGYPEQYPDCFTPAGMVCQVRVFVGGQPCEPGVPGCLDWWHHRNNPEADIDCRFGSYVVPIGNCEPLKRSYRPDAPAEGDPVTNPGGWPDPEWEPNPDPGGNPGTDPGTSPGPSPGTSPGPSPGTSPGPTPFPTTGTNPLPNPTNPNTADPDGSTASCLGSGWSWNPVSWVYTPVKCALVWAFKPKVSLSTRLANIKGTLTTKAPFSWLTPFAGLPAMVPSNACPDWRIKVDAVQGAGLDKNVVCDSSFTQAIRAARPVFAGFMIVLALWPLIRSTAYAAFPILKPTPGVLR